MGTVKTNHLIFSEQNGVGIITLNRPQALHALTHDMISSIEDQLNQWADSPSIVGVMIESSGGKAFCAGGDIKSVAEADPEVAIELFRDEYTLNYRIFNFPKPYIALVDGIVMGGGVGVSAHGTYRVVTENVLFAMPETAIGFFPDVGMGYTLSRYPDYMGVYLALTSKRIGLEDCMYTGYATHFVPSENMAELREEILKSSQDIEAVLNRFAKPVEVKSELAKRQADIAECFAGNTIEEILSALESHSSDWALKQVEVIRRMCPFSVKLALAQLRRSVSMDFHDVMVMEYRISRACIRRGDFREGVRAALIDRDNSPKWSPSRLEDVPDAEIEQCFTVLNNHELVLEG